LFFGVFVQSDEVVEQTDEVFRLDVVARPKDIGVEAAAASGRHHRRRWNAEAVIIIRIDRSCQRCSSKSQSTLVPHPSPRNVMFDDGQLVLVVVISSIFVVSSIIVVASLVICRRRRRRFNKSTSVRESVGVVAVRTFGVSMNSRVSDSIARRKPASLPIPPPPNYPPTELVSLARRCDATLLMRLASARENQQRDKFVNEAELATLNRRTGSVRGKAVLSYSSSPSTSADEVAGTRFENYFYDGASDSGLVDDDDFPSIIGSGQDALPAELMSSGATVQEHPSHVTSDMRNRHSIKYKRRKNDMRSATSGSLDVGKRSNRATSFDAVNSSDSEADDDHCRDVEPIYATVVGDVEESIENCFRFIAESGRADLFAVAERRQIYHQLESVFSDIARLPDVNGGAVLAAAEPVPNRGHKVAKAKRLSTGAMDNGTYAGQHRDDPNSARSTFNGERWTSELRRTDTGSPPVLIDSVVGPADMLRRPQPVAGWQRIAGVGSSPPTIDEVGLKSTVSDEHDDVLLGNSDGNGGGHLPDELSHYQTSRQFSYC